MELKSVGISLFAVIGTIADLLAIGLFLWQTVQKDNTKNIGIKLLIVSIIFVVSMFSYIISDNYNSSGVVDIFMQLAGYAYAFIGCISIVLLMYKSFSNIFTIWEFILGFIITLLPFLMSIILFVMDLFS